VSTLNSIILITGCSSGIGLALAQAFNERGCIVYATARHIESINTLASRGLRILKLDITDSENIEKAVEVIAQEHGRLDILINNARYRQDGAVVDLPAKALRRQFETNVIGPVQVARSFLPLLLAGQRGRIVNIGSISGIVATPFSGAYCASKAALNALSESMRMELSPFGIDVIMIQPGKIASNIRKYSYTHFILPPDSLYIPFQQHLQTRAQCSEHGAMSAKDFAAHVVEAVLADTAPIVIRKGPWSFKMPFLQRWLPKRQFDRFISELFGLTKPALKKMAFAHEGPRVR
jgi:NAD(P)-dependent dehydrogenase (short-subunit alcohol dehydrogenase family)